MLLDQLTVSSVLSISRSMSFDQFRTLESLADAESIPLRGTQFAAGFAALTLNSCSIYLQRTFPRILQARYRTTGAIVAFGMDDAASVTLDGREARPPALLFIRGDVACEIVEQRANMIAFLKFDRVEDRGWPDTWHSSRLIAAQPGALTNLRAVVRGALLTASTAPDLLLQPHARTHVEESILEAVDQALHGHAEDVEAGRPEFGRYVVLVRRLDELLRSPAPDGHQSADVATRLGVSVRTLNNAVLSIRGMSLYSYLTLRRLWNVRRQLLQVASVEAIRTIVVANGFWHMGEFRSLYYRLFQETPQQTVTAARRR